MKTINIEQDPVEKHLKENWDVAVIGAGPAGSIAALHIALKGRKVILLDKKLFPREKICGDGLVADSMRALKRAGIEDEVLSFANVNKAASIFSPSGSGLDVTYDCVTLKREILDAIIAKKARENGAVFCKGNIIDFSVRDDDSVEFKIEGIDDTLKARIGIFATGANIDLLHRHNLVQYKSPKAIAIRCYIKSTEILDRICLFYDRSTTPGYSWIFPMGGGVYNVGSGISYKYKNKKKVNLKKMFSKFCADFPVMKGLMAGLQEMTPLRGGVIRDNLDGASPEGPGNTIIIGEAIGTTLPFSGEGIGKAMESGELAAEIINEVFNSGDFTKLKNYKDLIKKNIGSKYRGYAIAEKWLAYPGFIDFIFNRIKKSRFLQEAVVNMTNDTVNPKDIFSIRGIISSLWR